MRAADYEHFAHALCDAEAPLPGGLRAPAQAALADRFAVYRNNVHVSLVEALAEGFPCVRAQVGDEFFRAMARMHVQQHKPSTPLLTHYGEHFPDFISTFEPASTLPWLPDLARMERAWSECWAAADAAALPVTALRSLNASELARCRFTAHPAVRLVRSQWPIASLWEAHQQAQPDLGALELLAEDVMLTRPQHEVLLQRLDADAARFIEALLQGESIETAAGRAPQVDAGAMLGFMLDNGTLLEIRR
jgi:hypothetical protein